MTTLSIAQSIRRNLGCTYISADCRSGLIPSVAEGSQCHGISGRHPRIADRIRSSSVESFVESRRWSCGIPLGGFLRSMRGEQFGETSEEQAHRFAHRLLTGGAVLGIRFSVVGLA